MTKPADYDDTPEFLPDPAAVKPDEWDDDEDGEVSTWLINVFTPDL